MLLGPLHSDADYGHQEGEINFWLPLTDVKSNNTLWAETEVRNPQKGNGNLHVDVQTNSSLRVGGVGGL